MSDGDEEELVGAVDLPAVGLQLVVRDQPTWRALPAVRVDRDRPEGVVLEVNAAARAAGVLPGMRFAAALALTPKLHAGVLPPAQLDAAVQELLTLLRRFSPRVEAARAGTTAAWSGSFWLDGAGLERLWSTPLAWASALLAALRDAGWTAQVAVAPHRFAAWALARGLARRHGGVIVAADAATTTRLVAQVPLDRVELPARSRDALARLGVADLGGLLALPAAGVRRRFGPEALALWRLAAGQWRPALRPDLPTAPLAQQRHLDDGTDNTDTLLFLCKQALPALLRALAARHQRVARLQVTLQVVPAFVGHDAPPPPSEVALELPCAEPTLDEATLLQLLRLRLERTPLAGEVIGVAVDAVPAPAAHAQHALALGACQRDLHAAAAAIAQVRAALGEQAVVRPTLAPRGPLPEQRFAWQPAAAVAAPQACELPAGSDGLPSLVRRLRAAPELLPPQPRHVRDDGWLVRGLDHGAVVRSFGPWLVSGGWWDQPFARELQFAELGRGEVLWISLDRAQRRWWLLGSVE